VKSGPPAVADAGDRLPMTGPELPDELGRYGILTSVKTGVVVVSLVASPTWYWTQRLFALENAEPLAA
jgi:hypothetical protein